ncbi:MAG: hypothetical protein V4666_09970 [Bacteroidota bacterium]
MAYLTNFSFNKLIEMTEVQDVDRIDLQFFTTNIYDNQYLYYFFNQFELKKLFRSKILLSDSKAYILTYKDVPERIDNYSFILPVKGQVKYHMKLDCEALNRGFKNFFMPEVIVRLKENEPEKHQSIVEEIRNWFNQNNYTILRYENHEINSLEITKNFNSYFPKKYDIEPIMISDSDKLENNFQWYISKKTDNIEVQIEFNYDDFIDNMILVIKKRHILCDTLEKDSLSRFDYMLKMTDTDINIEINSGILSNLSFCINKMGLIKLKEFWANHINLKNEAMKMLTEYFKWSYNFKEKQFDTIYLESFNLAKCRMCADE